MKSELLNTKMLVLACSLAITACGGNSPPPDNTNSGSTPTTPVNSPSLNFNANQTAINSGQTVNLSWDATNVVSCTASGDWSGTKQPSGSELSVSLTVDTSFILDCDGSNGSISQTVNVTVNAIPITPPGAKPLIQLSDLNYQGAFRLPLVTRRG